MLRFTYGPDTPEHARNAVDAANAARKAYDDFGAFVSRIDDQEVVQCLTIAGDALRILCNIRDAKVRELANTPDRKDAPHAT